MQRLAYATVLHKRKNIHTHTLAPNLSRHLNVAPNRNKWVVKVFVCVCMRFVWCLHFRHKIENKASGCSDHARHISRPNRKCIPWLMSIIIWVEFPMFCCFFLPLLLLLLLFCIFIVNDRNKIIRIEMARNSLSNGPFTRARSRQWLAWNGIELFVVFGFSCHHPQPSTITMRYWWGVEHRRFTSLIVHCEFRIELPLSSNF